MCQVILSQDLPAIFLPGVFTSVLPARAAYNGKTEQSPMLDCNGERTMTLDMCVSSIGVAAGLLGGDNEGG